MNQCVCRSNLILCFLLLLCPSPAYTQDTTDDDTSSNVGIGVGIGLGCIVLLGLVIGLLFLLRWRKNRNQFGYKRNNPYDVSKAYQVASSSSSSGQPVHIIPQGEIPPTSDWMFGDTGSGIQWPVTVGGVGLGQSGYGDNGGNLPPPPGPPPLPPHTGDGGYGMGGNGDGGYAATGYGFDGSNMGMYTPLLNEGFLSYPPPPYYDQPITAQPVLQQQSPLFDWLPTTVPAPLAPVVVPPVVESIQPTQMGYMQHSSGPVSLPPMVYESSPTTLSPSTLSPVFGGGIVGTGMDMGIGMGVGMDMNVLPLTVEATPPIHVLSDPISGSTGNGGVPFTTNIDLMGFVPPPPPQVVSSTPLPQVASKYMLPQQQGISSNNNMYQSSTSTFPQHRTIYDTTVTTTKTYSTNVYVSDDPAAVDQILQFPQHQTYPPTYEGGQDVTTCVSDLSVTEVSPGSHKNAHYIPPLKSVFGGAPSTQPPLAPSQQNSHFSTPQKPPTQPMMVHPTPYYSSPGLKPSPSGASNGTTAAGGYLPQSLFQNNGGEEQSPLPSPAPSTSTIQPLSPSSSGMHADTPTTSGVGTSSPPEFFY
eukprot:NODE_30_length_2465_cov_409.800257_g29_i0.p1 GENE.NODE_30_length_2465_cov_409.800257_g29_i0~~NODE_30_length_2465_cov_409.800257_g29_i0.p1  ORF type:complete len:585 (+),score=207.05 NODE_30_length_2465_cov_409.800257_g29_i0:511-2265(+)